MSERIIQIKDGSDNVYPRVVRDCVVPNKGQYPYIGESVMPHKNEYRARKVAGLYGQQGLAIYGDYAFRLDTGNSSGTQAATMKVYDISDMGNVRQVGTFTLQSGGKANHANSAQFAPFPEGGNDFPYLYVSGNYTSYCGVYKVTTSGATLVQTISVVNERFDLQGMHPNVQVGDDGYLYAVSDDGGDNDFVMRWELPKVSAGDVTLNDNNCQLGFTLKRDKSLSQTWQGMKIYGGKVYFLRGMTSGIGIEVIDIGQEKISSVIPVNIMAAEPEDLEVWNDRLIVAYGNQSQFLILSF